VRSALATAIFVSLAVSSAVAAAPAAEQTQLLTLEQNLRTEINAVRAQYGLRPLRPSHDLTRAAEAYTRTMLRKGFFDHNSPTGITLAQRLKSRYSPAGYARWTVGENLLSSSANIDARRAVELWMNSPHHRDNLLSPTFRQMGIAAVHQRSAPGVFGGNDALVITLDLGARSVS
jgi:uncharacterized protein YkwD